ncbi:MAG: 3-deoxy-manno-octulosonate cytidylyltransferase [Gammaproteobacteria bacterium]|nr:3-deoxy-manno-octulosonate cytidylyltransferase [Gammaproteobacteria bacterium]MDH4255495.1 3-deoxy-manno-octulosonate cytidylyltransferase [Gammaproteobacteria bacterium]MDH5311157.1 3-deoxy-manno-octulosonate cytidylyltransferase [Gammaproteobacteria bacterium]
MTEFAVVIPSRYASERLPGKPLRDIAGKTMLQRVWERGIASAASEVVIATDDERIAATARGFGASVCLTDTGHQSGTDRIAEVAAALGWPDDRVVVNLQGDEPLMPPGLIRQCAALLDDAGAGMATLASAGMSEEEFRNPNVVRVLVDQDDFALYFSRAPIPYSRSRDTDGLARASALRHHGIYGYRCDVLQRLVAAPPSVLERCEKLEQLRALELGIRIKVGRPAERPGPGVDTEADLAAVVRLVEQGRK